MCSNLRMKILNHPIGRWAARLSLVTVVAGSISSCVVVPARHHHAVAVVGPAPIAVLPIGARPVMIRGERCWVHHGTYYRRHPHGYVVFVP